MKLTIVRRSAVAALLLACTPGGSRGQTASEISFRIADRDPVRGATLSRGQPLYLRISYNSNVPVRFRAKAYSEGELMERGAAYNPAPPYPAGAGDALAWIWFTEPTRINEIRLTAFDERWHELATESFTIEAVWTGAPGRQRREPAAWAQRLSDEQQARVTAAATTATENSGGGVMITLMMLSIPAYLLLQAYMLMRFRNGWRIAAMVPLAGTIPLALVTVLGLAAGANLWPLAALFLTPFALGYLMLLGVVRFVIPGRAGS